MSWGKKQKGFVVIIGKSPRKKKMDKFRGWNTPIKAKPISPSFDKSLKLLVIFLFIFAILVYLPAIVNIITNMFEGII